MPKVAQAEKKQEPEKQDEPQIEPQALDTGQDDDGGKPKSNVIEHPKFQERIDEFTRRLDAAQTKLTQSDQAFEILKKQNEDLAKALESVEDRVSVSAAPDYEENPRGYMEWQANETLRKVEKMLKATNTTTAPTTYSAVPQTTQPQIDPREAAISALHDDYYEIAMEVSKDMQSDLALKNAFLDTPNPFKAAYDYGVRKRKLAEDLRQGNLSQAYTEGGTIQPSGDDNKLTKQEIDVAAKLGVSQEKFLARKKLINKRRGK